MKKATEKQLNYINILIKNTEATVVTPVPLEDLNVQQASQLIDELKARKATQVVAEVHQEFQANVVKAYAERYPVLVQKLGGKGGLDRMARKLGFDPTGKYPNGGALFAGYEPTF
jgi:hypothetical protein